MAILTKNVNIHLSDEQYHYLLKIAEEQHKSISAVIRDALSQIYDIRKSEESKPNNSTNENDLDQKEKRLLEAFEKARGIWKDYDEIDAIRKETKERWQEWQKELEKSA
jgi:predicted CopG family antitoxin